MFVIFFVYLQYKDKHMKTLEEMTNDFESVSDAYTASEKREIAERYNVDSIKQADIQRAILLEIRNERQSRCPQTWTDTDVLWFLRLHDFPYSTQKWRKSTEGESKEWMEFVLDTEIRHIKRDKNRKNAMRLRDVIKEKYTVKDSPENKMFDLLNEMTSEFRSECVDAYAIHALSMFDEYLKIKDISLRDAISLFGGVEDRRYKRTVLSHLFNDGKPFLFMGRELKPSVVSVTAFYNEDGHEGYSLRPGEYCDRVVRKINEISSESNGWDRNVYGDCKRNEADKAFTSKLKALAEKILRFGIDTDKMKIEHIDTDPKVFDAYITDGTTMLHARSILAAEYSNYMVPHYRFIITKKNDKYR